MLIGSGVSVCGIAGCTAFPDKLDALLFVISLETAFGNREECLAQYGERVISTVTDQGFLTLDVSFAFALSRVSRHGTFAQ